MKPNTLIILPLTLMLASCMIQETNRATPNLLLHDKHVRANLAERPEFAELMQAEELAVKEYFDSIGTTDSRNMAAKAALAKAVDAVEKKLGGK